MAVNTGVKNAFVVIYKGGRRAGENYSTASTSQAGVDTAVASKAAPAAASNQITFKVQVGAYRSDVSENKLTALKALYNADISQSLSATGLHVVYAGSFTDYNAAVLLKNYLTTKGAKDAFVVAFSGDVKIPLPKALSAAGK